jgi:large subunit ribosomal protein L25
MKKVKVKGLYKDIPETILLNVDNLEIGKTIKVRDCEFDNYELVNAKDLVIAGVRTTRAAANAVATEEGEEGAAEGDAATAAE